MRALGLAAALHLAACYSNAGDPVDPIAGSAGKVDTTLPYPSDVKGTSKGQVIDNFCFPGFVDAVASQAEVQICLAHFYNPEGTGTFGPLDPFEDGTPKPKAIVVDVSGKWCGPCKQEASQTLPGKWADLHPKGLMILTVLADGDKPGQPAAVPDLVAWTTAFQARYPSVIDPSYQLGGLFDSGSYPANFIIDARTMKIFEFVAGKPPESFWDKASSLL